MFVLASRSAPERMSSSTARGWPFSAAIMSAVHLLRSQIGLCAGIAFGRHCIRPANPRIFFAETSAPTARSISRAGMCPFRAARMSAVRPSLSAEPADPRCPRGNLAHTNVAARQKRKCDLATAVEKMQNAKASTQRHRLAHLPRYATSAPICNETCSSALTFAHRTHAARAQILMTSIASPAASRRCRTLPPQAGSGSGALGHSCGIVKRRNGGKNVHVARRNDCHVARRCCMIENEHRLPRRR